jgi:hypothetical protein
MDVLLVDRARRIREILSASGDKVTLPGRGVLPVDAIPPSWLQGTAVPDAHGLLPATHGRPVPQTRADVALLLLVAGQWQELLDLAGDAAHHVTLSFALPLWLDTSWRRWVLENLDLVTAGRQLVVVPALELVAVDPLGVSEKSVLHRHRRLLRRHALTSVHRASPQAALAWWEWFSERRHGRRPDADELAALARIASMAGCEAREYRTDGSAVATALICRHGPTRTMFDLLAPWDTTRAHLRPGVYSAVANLLAARREQLRYCLCYGSFPYKDDIVGGLRRLSLSDLAAVPG